MLLNHYRKLTNLLVCLVGLGLVVFAQPVDGEATGPVRYTVTRDPMVLLEALTTINNSGMDAQVFFTDLGGGIYEMDVYILPGPATGYNDFEGDSPWIGNIDWNTSYEYAVTGPWMSSHNGP